MSFSSQPSPQPALDQIYNTAILYKQGGVITVASNTTLTITPILCRDSLDAFDINVGNYFGQTYQDPFGAIVTVAPTNTTLNAAVNGLNGLDTGSLAASKVYAVWAISDPANYNTSGYLLSLSATAPYIPAGVNPSGYASMRRIGWAVTDASSHFLPIVQSGTGSVVTYTYDSPVIVLNAGTSGTQAAVSLAAVVPAVAGMPVILNGDFVSDTAGKSATICYSGGTIANSRNIFNAQVATVHVIQNYTVPAVLISSVPKVDYIISAATSTLSLYVSGFVDLL